MTDVQNLLAAQDLQSQGRSREIDLDLDKPADRPRSRVLHQVRLLGQDGFDRIGGADLAARDDLTRVWERWRVAWGPDSDAPASRAPATARPGDSRPRRDRRAAARGVRPPPVAPRGPRQLEAKLFAALDKYGLRGRGDE